jgi:hypothetical protein
MSVEFFLALIYVLLLFSITFPYGFPLFFPFVFVYFVLFLMQDLYKGRVFIKLHFGIMLFIFCILLYVFGILANYGIIYQNNIRDIKNIMSLLCLIFILNRLDWDNYEKFTKIFHKLVVPVLSFVALFSLYNFYRLIAGSDVLFITMEQAEKAIGTSLSGSYNMFALGMFGGIFAAYSGFYRSESALFKVVCFVCILVCSTAIVLSGSRRGWIVLGFFAFAFFLRTGVELAKISFVGVRRIFVFSRKNFFTFFLTITLLGVILVVSWNFNFNIEKPREIKKLVYRLSTLGPEGGGFERAFSKRTNLWLYFGELIDQYSWPELLLGSGFEYLELYGKVFHGKDSEGDPHNFVFSAMLYSGLVGCAGVLALILWTFWLLLKNRKKFGNDIFLLYVTALVFTIIGAPSLFSVRLLPVIMLTTFSVDY